MDADLPERVARLERQLDQLQLELDAERAEAARRRRRESWTRITLILLIAIFYAVYFRGLSGL